MKWDVQAFKCSLTGAQVTAWCSQCNWASKGLHPGTTKRPAPIREARKHTQETGHTTYHEVAHQRGFRGREPS